MSSYMTVGYRLVIDFFVNLIWLQDWAYRPCMANNWLQTYLVIELVACMTNNWLQKYLVIELVVRSVCYRLGIAWLQVGYTKLVVVWLQQIWLQIGHSACQGGHRVGHRGKNWVQSWLQKNVYAIKYGLDTKILLVIAWAYTL